ncbi:hypothetical protein CA54_01070 [Symmachiella macrocystis]|uniref:Uncharacterized protein n=1 Tax=Symmachiella macrocystis TaxID=2527985 RepID=A0A5C6BHV6_9PLAN|nr:hypothetical protein [Symmachiella macrocystis]TWU11302.1 hypothetical protein CA54_01070 [Symmachiella macrocystis]
MSAPPFVIIQRIRSEWTKESRGGEGARRRNAVPQALPLPESCFTDRFAHQTVRFLEREEFRRPERDSIAIGDSWTDMACSDLEITVVTEGLQVRLVTDARNAASGDVQTFRAFTLVPGTWGQLIYNARYVHVYTGIWTYERSVLNIGYLKAVQPKRFTSSSPNETFSRMLRLH